jgi:hypothetical protein
MKDKRTLEDFKEAAEEAMAMANTLAGMGTMSDRDFLENMTRMDRLLDHDVEVCGHCYQRFLNAEVARELLAEGDILDGIDKWAAESERRWQEGKYFKLWQAEQAAGRDPRKAFAERGWEP